MNEELIREVIEEIKPALVGRLWGKAFQLSAAVFAFDFRTRDGRYLFVSVAPNAPRLYMVSRTVRELEKSSTQASTFALVLRKALGGATLRSLTKDAGERVVRFTFDVPDAVGAEHKATLVAQLTGRTSNLFLLDEGGRIVAALRPSRGEGQEEGELYSPPTAPARTKTYRPDDISRAGFASLSEALDSHYTRLEREAEFDARASAALARARQDVARLRKLRENLARDLDAHGDADEHKRVGDLLLANIGTAVREGRMVRVTDYYAEDAPFVEFEVDENRSLQEEAARRFARYSKARRAAREIYERLKTIDSELAVAEARREELERIAASRDAEALDAFKAETGRRPKQMPGARAKSSKKEGAQSMRGLRRYLSSDGYEILVGRGARENDQLTFRVARSYDTWMHAADYPGSHVVIRARTRDEQIPHRTIVEAARLAAHFSQAGKDSKVAVNYTQRKFITKPKGAAPGLVYLSSFRTLMVEPREELERV